MRRDVTLCHAAHGFSLVELMIVVAIIGVLSVVSTVAFRKYTQSARAAEVYGMFGEIRNKEEAYRVEFNNYCNVQTGTPCATGADETSLFPALLSGGEPVAKAVGASTPTLPPGWTTLGLQPPATSLYCGYSVVAGIGGTLSAGAPTSTGPAAGTNGAPLLKGPTGTAPAQQWWYANAACDPGTGIKNWFTTSNADNVVTTALR